MQKNKNRKKSEQCLYAMASIRNKSTRLVWQLEDFTVYMVSTCMSGWLGAVYLNTRYVFLITIFDID